MMQAKAASPSLVESERRVSALQRQAEALQHDVDSAKAEAARLRAERNAAEAEAGRLRADAALGGDNAVALRTDNERLRSSMAALQDALAAAQVRAEHAPVMLHCCTARQPLEGPTRVQLCYVPLMCTQSISDDCCLFRPSTS
jgi:chromosome segregation ATPase